MSKHRRALAAQGLAVVTREKARQLLHRHGIAGVVRRAWAAGRKEQRTGANDALWKQALIEVAVEALDNTYAAGLEKGRSEAPPEA